MALPLPTVGVHTNAAYYSFTDPEGMKGWVGLVGWPIADGLPTIVVSHQLWVERGTRKFVGHRPTFVLSFEPEPRNQLFSKELHMYYVDSLGTHCNVSCLLTASRIATNISANHIVTFLLRRCELRLVDS